VLTSLTSSGVLAATAVGVGDQPASARSWIWAVAAGLLLSGALLAHAAWRAFCALPEPVRTAATATVRRHPRLLAVQAALAVWTLVYALYNLAYPGSFLSPPLAQAATVSSNVSAAVPVVAPPAAVPVPQAVPAAAPLPVAAAPAPVPGAASETAVRSAPAPVKTAAPIPSPSPQPCQVRPATDVLRMLDGPATTVSGRPLGSEAATAAEAAAGCQAPARGWAELVVGRTPAVGVPAAHAAATDLATRCGDVLGQLVVLRFIAPIAGLRVSYVDTAISDVTAACGRTERTSP
jgi:hypothetical protein